MKQFVIILGAIGALSLGGCSASNRDFGSGGGGGQSSSSEASSDAATTSASSSAASAASSSSSGGGGRHAVYPVAPDAMHFMWQGVQKAFLDEMSQPCAGSVTISVGDQAVCYVAAGGALRCAGSIYTKVFGPQFTDVQGAMGVDQILISPTFNAADHNSICVRTTAGTAMCVGGDNDQGEFGGGDKNPSMTFVPWGNISGIVALVTGTWDQICAATSGAASCAGYSYGVVPVPVAPKATSLWIDTAGMVHADDATVFRAANGRTDCQVTAQGLKCDVGTLGTSGDVVDGTYTLQFAPPGVPPGQSRYCWLNTQGRAYCNIYDMLKPGPPSPVSMSMPFSQRPVLALAGNPYTSSLCAVYNDGSIACMGKNDKGQLGIAPSAYVAAETIVAPPGSIDITCN